MSPTGRTRAEVNSGQASEVARFRQRALFTHGFSGKVQRGFWPFPRRDVLSKDDKKGATRIQERQLAFFTRFKKFLVMVS